MPRTFMFPSAHSQYTLIMSWARVGVGWGAKNVHVHLQTQALHADHVGLGWGGGPITFIKVESSAVRVELD